MEWIKKIGIESRTLINSLVVALSILTSCNHNSNYIESFLKIDELNTIYKVDLKNINDFKWETLYVFSNLTYPNDIEKTIRLKYTSDVVSDNSKRYIFILDGKIVKEYDVYSDNFSYYKINQKGDNYCKLLFSDKVIVERFDNNDRKSYIVNQIIPARPPADASVPPAGASVPLVNPNKENK